MFQVLENNKPADSSAFTILRKDGGWDKSKFTTLSEAIEYARNWLGDYAPYDNNLLLGGYDYNGYGDVIRIIEVL